MIAHSVGTVSTLNLKDFAGITEVQTLWVSLLSCIFKSLTLPKYHCYCLLRLLHLSKRSPACAEPVEVSVARGIFLKSARIFSVTFSPSSILMIRWLYLASCSLWVTIMIVVPASLSSVSRSITSLPLLLSRLPVGSSARISLGLLTTARATATRCCCPPDNCCGKCLRRCIICIFLKLHARAPFALRFLRRYKWAVIPRFQKL